MTKTGTLCATGCPLFFSEVDLLPFFLVVFVVLTTKEPAFAVTALQGCFFMRAAGRLCVDVPQKRLRRAVVRGAAWVLCGMAAALCGVLLCRGSLSALLCAVSVAFLYLTFYALAVLLSPRLSQKAARAFCTLLALLPSLFFFAFASSEATVHPLVLLLQLVVGGVLLGVGIARSKAA